MKNDKEEYQPKFMERLSSAVTKASGSNGAIIAAFVTILVWAMTGPFFHYSETWQLIINTGTTIITFLMVFLIQKSQNKDSMAIHLKLNELIKSHKESSNRLIDVENMTEDQILIIQKHYENLNKISKKAIKEIHEEADELKDDIKKKVKEKV